MTRTHIALAAIVALMAASLAACDKATPAKPDKPAVDTAKIAEAVKADATQRIADVNAHDADKMASHNAADAVSMFHGRANATGPAAIGASFKASLAGVPGLHVTMSDPVVDVAASGDMAVIRSTTVATYADPKTGKPVTVTNNSLAGYKPQADGAWKIEWSVVSDTAAPPPATPPAKG